MTMLFSGQTIPLTLGAGQALVVKDMSGVSSISGASIPRESAASSIGEGFAVYGPVASSTSISLTTTGTTDYRVVSGDPTPRDPAVSAAFAPAFAYNYVTLALFGDSRFDDAYITAGAANSTLGIAIGDTYVSSGNPQTWAEIMGCGLISVRNYAVSGSKTATLDGRVTSFLSDALPVDTTVPAFLSSANDRAVAPVVASSVSLENFSKAVARCRGAGYDVAVCIEPPQRDSYWTGIMPSEHVAFVAGQRALVAQDPLHIRAADFYSAIVDGNGSVPPQGTAADPYTDQVHFKARGALLTGRQLSNSLDYRLPKNRLSAGLALETTGNVLTNPEFTGSSTTTVINSGTVGSNWRSDRTAGNSWEKSLVCSATASARANSTAYAVGDRITVNQLPAPTARANSTAYAVGDRITVSSKPGFEFVCTTAGTSAASAPTFNTFIVGATTTDGTAVFTAVEKVDVGALFQAVEFVCLTAGTSDSSLPRFAFNLFETTTDGSAVFVAVPRHIGFDGFRSHLLYGDGTTDNVRGSFRQDISMATAGLAAGDTIEASIFWKSMFAWQGIQLEVQFLTGGAAGIGASGTKVRSDFFPGMNFLNTNLEEYGLFGRLRNRVVIPNGCDTIRFVPTVFSRAGVRQAHYFTKPVLRKVTA